MMLELVAKHDLALAALEAQNNSSTAFAAKSSKSQYQRWVFI
jgi:hypothetical protein